MKNIYIIKNRSDIGAGTRGSDMGIDAIEIAAINFNNNFFNKYPFEDIKTENETIYEKSRTNHAIRIKKVFSVCEKLSKSVSRSLKNNYFPIILSGDHSSSLGTISGVKSARPNKKLGVIWIDAHADIHTPYTTPSGNVHGMPVAASLGVDNLENKKNIITKEAKIIWNKLKNLDGISPKIVSSDIVYFGLRDLEESEVNIVKNEGITIYKVEEMRYKGIVYCVSEALKKLDTCDSIYVSFDVDSLDCDSVSHGTGTPVPKGFDINEILEIIKVLISSNKICAFEISEVNPCLDNRGNKMAEVAFTVLEKFTQQIITS